MKKCYRCYYRSRITLSCDYYMVTGARVSKTEDECSGFRQRCGDAINPNEIEMEKLYYKGLSDRAISRELGISRYAVYSWRISLGLEPRGDEQRGRPRKEEKWKQNTATSE